MKKYFLFLIILFLYSCASNFSSRVNVVNVKPEIKDGKAIYIYYESVNTLPDNAEYIGELTLKMSLTKLYLWGIGPNQFELLKTIEDATKKAGGNFVMLENWQSDNSEPMKGKIYKIPEFQTTDYNESSLKELWNSKQPADFEGIYEFDISMMDDKYKGYFAKYGLVKKDSLNYMLVYLDGFQSVDELWGYINLNKTWRPGNIFGYLEKTENPFLFKSKIFSMNKFLYENCMIRLDNNNLRISTPNNFSIFMKVYPDSSRYEMLNGSLTGYAIDNKRIITCYHGVNDNENKIFIKGLNGNFDKKYEAVIDKTDKVNDLAILKLADTSISFSYNIFPATESQKTTAEEVFVLGYPISVLMGEEIKFTNGIISATSGIAGNMNYYQISAPVQPGNSGSPVFDNEGNFIGMVTSKITKADNVGYSLKFKELKNFLQKSGYDFKYETENNLKTKSLSEKVKYLQNSVYLIEIIDTKRPEKTFERRSGMRSSRNSR